MLRRSFPAKGAGATKLSRERSGKFGFGDCLVLLVTGKISGKFVLHSLCVGASVAPKAHGSNIQEKDAPGVASEFTIGDVNTL